MTKILHLTLKKKWFDLIKSGEKKIEYREIKPYWTERFCYSDGTYKAFDYIIFKNGYQKDAPELKVEWKSCRKGYCPIWDKKAYCIRLGKIIE